MGANGNLTDSMMINDPKDPYYQLYTLQKELDDLNAGKETWHDRAYRIATISSKIQNIKEYLANDSGSSSVSLSLLGNTETTTDDRNLLTPVKLGGIMAL